jgi:hypothetical protein
LTSRSNNCFLNNIFLARAITFLAAFRGDISFRYRKQFFLVKLHVLDTKTLMLEVRMSPLNAAKNVMARARKILFKKQLFDLEVKGQGPTKVKMVRDTALWSCTHIPNIIDPNNCFLNSIYLVCGCMTIRRCVTYRNDLCVTLTFDLKV